MVHKQSPAADKEKRRDQKRVRGQREILDDAIHPSREQTGGQLVE
jgi:hypothetical protein